MRGDRTYRAIMLVEWGRGKGKGEVVFLILLGCTELNEDSGYSYQPTHRFWGRKRKKEKERKRKKKR